MSLAILTTVFNTDHGSVRLSNLNAFISGLGEAAKLLHIAECRNDNKPFILDHLLNVQCFRAKSSMWQKERLLNLLLANLSVDIDAIAWVDADLIFENRNWWRLALRRLEDVDVIQPFSHVVNQNDNLDTAKPSFCWNVAADPASSEKRFHGHGHTGYAWVVRRDLIEKAGFYDACIAGGADHVIAHGFLGQLDSECVPPLLDSNGPQFKYYANWIEALGTVSKPFEIGFVSGIVEHLPHGTTNGRQYMVRNRILRETRFDPVKHLTRNRYGCWEWTARAWRPKRAVEKYLKGRALDEN